MSALGCVDGCSSRRGRRRRVGSPCFNLESRFDGCFLARWKWNGMYLFTCQVSENMVRAFLKR